MSAPASLYDFLADEVGRLRLLVAMLQAENQLLRKQPRAEFDLSADSEIPALCRKQAG
jgi:hypothetical protein